jgi:hypothetical protein
MGKRRQSGQTSKPSPVVLAEQSPSGDLTGPEHSLSRRACGYRASHRCRHRGRRATSVGTRFDVSALRMCIADVSRRVISMMSRLLIVAATGVVVLAAPVMAQTGSAPAASPTAHTTQRPMVKTAHEGRHASLYRRAQLKLKSMGDYAGRVDGRRHASYVRALERFQTAHHIRANGRLTPKTQRALGI